MCGINGIFAYGDAAPPVDEAELLRTREHMAQRGPDGEGLWLASDRRVGFGHRRLAIVDLSPAGAQPMCTADGRLTIVFNGEIYNYRELRRELSAAGQQFRTASDTEVLLLLYQTHGPAMIERLRGMFAFAIWDATARRLFLARDPFGIKPLYYTDDGRCFRFASQVRALIAGNGVDQSPDPAGHAGFLLWGHVPEPFTLFRAISALPAGAWLEVSERGASAPRTFFDLAGEWRRAEAAAADPGRAADLDGLSEVLADSVAHHMVSDVPVGVFLSAGIDSTVIATLAARNTCAPLRCVTLGFEEDRGGADDETPIASASARRLGAQHAVDWISREAFAEEISRVLAAMDQPSIDGVNTWFVARAAARQGLKVALSGLGGDELFLGYPSFRDVPRIARAFAFTRRLPGALLRGLRAALAPTLGLIASPKYAGLPEYGGSREGAYLLRRGLFMPWELPALLGREAEREGWERLRTLPALRAAREGVRSDASVVACLELSWYMRNQLLRDADWAGMAHSVEIRVPFVDLEVLRAAAPLAAAGALRSKRDVASLPALGIPRALLDRPKSGFRVPVREWISQGRGRRQRGLRSWAEKIHRSFAARRSILALVTEAFGGHGGIALYCRDLLAALCADGSTARVVAVPRIVRDQVPRLPGKLLFKTAGLGGKLRYARAIAGAVLSGGRVDLVICGHLNLAPLSVLAAVVLRAPMVLLAYGVDAWRPAGWLTNWAARRADLVLSISELTRERFLSWSGMPARRCVVLTNAIHLDDYGPGPKSEALLDRYGLRGRTVLMTLGRMAADERQKGFDEILEILPRLVERVPDLVYLVVGEGSDRARLEAKATALGVRRRVVFAGQVTEVEKADHYRLADAFAMPSRGEGFGFVFLEAVACGVPAVGSKTDGGREALKFGELGDLVDPSSAAELESAILAALRSPKRVPPGLESFSFEHFEQRCRGLIDRATVASA